VGESKETRAEEKSIEMLQGHRVFFLENALCDITANEFQAMRLNDGKLRVQQRNIRGDCLTDHKLLGNPQRLFGVLAFFRVEVGIMEGARTIADRRRVGNLHAAQDVSDPPIIKVVLKPSAEVHRFPDVKGLRFISEVASKIIDARLFLDSSESSMTMICLLRANMSGVCQLNCKFTLIPPTTYACAGTLSRKDCALRQLAGTLHLPKDPAIDRVIRDQPRSV
jgi:hypothetical protein